MPNRRAVLAGALAVVTPAGRSDAAEGAVSANGFPATLLDPGSRGPIAVLVAGSGPTDRDGNNPLGVTASYLRKLAQDLSLRGIASLRYDKRGVAGSMPPGPEADLVLDDFAADLGRVLAWLAERVPGRRTMLVGHSEGGLVALRAAASRDDVARLVLVATPGRRPAETLREQLGRLDEELRAPALAILARLEAGEMATDVPPALAPLFRPSVQPFLMSLLAIDPAAELARLPQPVLVIGGGTDIQVGRADFDALVKARPGIASRWFATMNHVLAEAPADLAANLATYADPGHALAAGLADVIAGFAMAA